MTSLRDHLETLAHSGDLLAVERSLHTVDELAMVGYESLKQNGPAISYEATEGVLRPVTGVYAGPDQLQFREQKPWTRLALALGLEADASYADLLEYVNDLRGVTALSSNERQPLAATPTNADLGDLGLPVPPTCEAGLVTLGLLAVEREGSTTWTPVRGLVRGPGRLHVSVPARFGSELAPRTTVQIALGVPAAALVTAYIPWFTGVRKHDPFPQAFGPDSMPVASIDDAFVPSSSEVVLTGRVGERVERLGEPLAGWERLTETSTLAVEVDGVRSREEPTIPFATLGAPLSDDIQLAGLLEGAKLHNRINNYWGVSPIDWLLIPPEARLSLCIVASEILYAGFEWQLANALFTFSDSFDKVLILDTDVPSTDLGRALEDMWVKAHPSHDWIFSSSDASAATAPLYRQDGTTGSRLYINATWDPRWDDEYVAPRVGFEQSYPTALKDAVRNSWTELGFETDVE